MPFQHPRQTPVAGDTVPDPFAGSGTTLQAAIELERVAIGIDTEAAFVQMCREKLVPSRNDPSLHCSP